MIWRAPIIMNIFLWHFHIFPLRKIMSLSHPRWNQFLSHDLIFKHIILWPAILGHDTPSVHWSYHTFTVLDSCVFTSPHFQPTVQNQSLNHSPVRTSAPFPHPSFSQSLGKTSALIKSYAACSTWLADLTLNSWPVTPMGPLCCLVITLYFPNQIIVPSSQATAL